MSACFYAQISEIGSLDENVIT